MTKKITALLLLSMLLTAGGCAAEKPAERTVGTDTSAPQITCGQMSIEEGSTFDAGSFCSLWDDTDWTPELRFFSTGSMDTAGRYPVTITSRDAAGNLTIQTAYVDVKGKAVPEPPEKAPEGYELNEQQYPVKPSESEGWSASHPVAVVIDNKIRNVKIDTGIVEGTQSMALAAAGILSTAALACIIAVIVHKKHGRQ